MNDHEHIRDVQKKLKEATARLREMAPMVGHAKQVLKYDSDRCKNLLARYALDGIKAGKTAAAANIEARANPAYQLELEGLSEQRESAEKIIAEYDAEKCRYEAARSLHSMEKQILGI